MLLLTLLFTIPFVFHAFTATEFLGDTLNPFARYFTFQFSFLELHWLVGILLIIFLSFFSLFFIRFEAEYSFFKKYYFSFLQTGISVFLGFFVSLVLLYTVAFLELNFFSVLLRLSPQSLGVVTDQQVIYQSLRHVYELPTVIATDTDQTKELAAVAAAMTGKDTYFGRYFLPSVPSFAVLPSPPSTTSVKMVANTLIISEIDPRDMQPLSPMLGYLFVKNYFQNRKIRAFPSVRILDRNEYAQIRLSDSKKKAAVIGNDITKMESLISSQSALIQADKDALTSATTQSEQTKQTQSIAYAKCLSEGNFQGNTFQHTYTKEYCQSVYHPENLGDVESSSAATLTTKLQNDQALLTKYLTYEIFFKRQKLALSNLAINIPHELGVFDPKDSIKVAVDTSSSHAVADYLETLTHEYFHYTSYVSETKKFSDLFFEEGLTEYFARQAITTGLHVNTNLGYPVFVRIITEMTNSIPESDFADIYFTKDEASLEKTLDSVYGDHFYENNKLIFETLAYASSTKETLQLANEIMKQIGGKPLTPQDLVSSYSNF